MYHQPVLLNESVDALQIKENSVYVDATFGGGGHARAILEKMKNGKLIAFDQDADAAKEMINDQRLTFVPNNFRHLQRFLRLHQITSVDGILADLGISSHQIDTPERGFSTRYDAALDMRMNADQEITAATIVNEYTEQQLVKMFSEYGEIRNSKTLAAKIVESRKQKSINTTAELIAAIESCIIGFRHKYLAQVFQSIRIEVNDELGALKDLLTQSLEVLKPGGRVAIISYHSLEDRLVKNFFKSGSFEGVVEKDFYGNISTPFTLITKKSIEPSEGEIKMNPRSRSARLRVAMKN